MNEPDFVRFLRGPVHPNRGIYIRDSASVATLLRLFLAAPPDIDNGVRKFDSDALLQMLRQLEINAWQNCAH